MTVKLYQDFSASYIIYRFFNIIKFHFFGPSKKRADFSGIRARGGCAEYYRYYGSQCEAQGRVALRVSAIRGVPAQHHGDVAQKAQKPCELAQYKGTRVIASCVAYESKNRRRKRCLAQPGREHTSVSRSMAPSAGHLV